ncbi:ribosome recycling factor [soil metagenome]
MSPNQVTDQAKKQFKQTVEHFEEELSKVRTGRAHPGMLDGIVVQAYGTPMPLIQVASVTAPEAQLLQIAPFDPTNLPAISTAIRENQSLGLNPMDDGKVVRVPIPPLNEERRREYVKLVGAKLEDCMVSMRTVRHDAMKTIDQAKKDKDISEDDAKRLADTIDASMAEQKAVAESLAKAKETEIMTV